MAWMQIACASPIMGAGHEEMTECSGLTASCPAAQLAQSNVAQVAWPSRSLRIGLALVHCVALSFASSAFVLLCAQASLRFQDLKLGPIQHAGFVLAVASDFGHVPKFACQLAVTRVDKLRRKNQRWHEYDAFLWSHDSGLCGRGRATTEATVGCSALPRD